MKHIINWALGGAALSIVIGLAAAQAPRTPAGRIALPAENVMLRPSSLAGYEVAQRQCLTCHSADYIAYQPPGMNLAQWTGEVNKMHGTYGAPIAGEDIRLVGIYLTATYGAAGSLSAADIAAPAPASASVIAVNDAGALAASNGCTACHAAQQKIVGPAFHDVADKYRNDLQALAKVRASIREGGVGRWGNVPMPPFAGLSEAQLKALAEYVLQQ